MTWQRTYACWRPMTREALEDGPFLDVTWQSMVDDLRRILREAGWRAEDLVRPLAPDIKLRMSDSNSDFRVRNIVALMAETRALHLLHPDPLPDLRPFRWQRR